MKPWTSIAYLAVVVGAVACATLQPGEASALEQGAAHLGAALWDSDRAAAPAANGP